MRTKLELDLEAKQRELYADAANPPPDFLVSHTVNINIVTDC